LFSDREQFFYFKFAKAVTSTREPIVQEEWFPKVDGNGYAFGA
jgi:hypothetical protein